MTQTPVVLLAEELSPATVDALGAGFEIRSTHGANRDELLRDIADVDAIMIRSATRLDAEAFAAAKNLKVVARAGVGLDNVDIAAATASGVMVVNAPTSNIISAAELTVGHILGLCRNISAADASMRAGEWKRSKYTGVELFEKKVGIIGLGRIGGLVAERLQSFGTEILAYDPFVSGSRAASLGASMVDLETLFRESDIITIHMPKTPETVGMVDAKAFELMKPSALVVNVARGGLIDEDDLAEALKNKTIAGAAIDVYVSEPAEDVDFVGLDNVVTTPHLGASTVEAQEKAGISVAKSVKLALEGELVPDAVNVAGGPIDAEVRPGIPLAEKLGRVLTSLTQDSALASVEVKIAGEIADRDVSSLKLAALKGVFTDVISEKVSYVNAPGIAEQRGVETSLTTTHEVEGFRNETTLSAILADGSRVSVSGTVTGPKLVEKLTGINGFDFEVALTENMLFLDYRDRPGVIAAMGTLLGTASINIAGMQVSSSSDPSKEQRAFSVLALDSAATPELLASIKTTIDADLAASVSLAE
ncbi:phosphoglycerate dehydrogenase [Kocuria sp. HSID16901]|uniref:phosphoglycerate dehydrogenase n=1 Tax=Kocuria sp. HSID16901 TaxID=2419505 RepID=UPI00065FEC9D|nr:phosphoglycerate dehydrogenase [Kocuria sp. HSID16901]RUQ22427.1 phosphoglycerate dehydrogenase [Kocuria sp. HSID16901]